MKIIKIFNFAIAILLFGFLFQSCSKDQDSVLDKSGINSLQKRSYSPGVFSIVNGRVSFPDFDEYDQTVDFIANASPAQLDSFRNVISIETVAKAYVEFVSLMEDDSLSEQDAVDLDVLFAGKVSVTTDEDGYKQYDLLHDMHPEIMNLAGEYEVGGSIIKQIGTKLISILPGYNVDISLLDENTESDEENGIYVHETRVDPRSCCPTSFQDSKVYTENGQTKRLQGEYRMLSEVTSFKLTDGTVYRAIIFVRAIGIHERRKSFIFFKYWGNDNTCLKLEFEATVTHNWSGLGIQSPVVFKNFVPGPRCNTSRFEFMEARGNSPVNKPGTLNLCVESVFFKVTNTTNNQFIQYSCG